jgi:hypothetical protein
MFSGGPSQPTRRNTNLLPNDLSKVESAVLELNDQELLVGPTFQRWIQW